MAKKSSLSGDMLYIGPPSDTTNTPDPHAKKKKKKVDTPPTHDPWYKQTPVIVTFIVVVVALALFFTWFFMRGTKFSDDNTHPQDSVVSTQPNAGVSRDEIEQLRKDTEARDTIRDLKDQVRRLTDERDKALDERDTAISDAKRAIADRNAAEARGPRTVTVTVPPQKKPSPNTGNTGNQPSQGRNIGEWVP